MFRLATKEDKDEFIAWEYPDLYDFYNIDEKERKHIYSEDYWVKEDDEGNIFGFLCIGKEAQINTVDPSVYKDDALDIGLGINPKYTSKGYGESYVNEIIDFLDNKYKPDKFRLTVASFNERAMTVYKRVGFQLINLAISTDTGVQFYILERDNDGHII